MPVDRAELLALYERRTAELEAMKALHQHLKAGQEIARRRKLMYEASLPAADLDETVQWCDWWARTVTIAAVAASGALVAGALTPGAIAWMATTRAAGAVAARTWLTEETAAWLAGKGAAMLISGQIQKAVSSRVMAPAPGSSILGTVFEMTWNQTYFYYLGLSEMKMLKWKDLSFLPEVLADPYQFTFDLERGYKEAARKAGVSDRQIENEKAKFCAIFWKKAYGKITTELTVRNWTNEICDRERRLERLAEVIDCERCNALAAQGARTGAGAGAPARIGAPR